MTTQLRDIPGVPLEAAPIDTLGLGARDALHLVVALGDFHSRMTRDQDALTILDATRLLLRRLLPFKALLFMMVNDASADFDVALCDPPRARSRLAREIDARIDDGTFAFALRQRRAIMVPAGGVERTLVLHPLLTRSRVLGMFVAVLDGGQPRVTDVLTDVLSVVLFSTAQALENSGLYTSMRETTVSKAALEAANAELRQEIAERRRAEEALRIEEERYRALFDNANDCIYTHDLAGRFTSINPAAERVFGLARGEGLGRSVFDVVAPDHAERMRALVEQTLEPDAPAAVGEVDVVARDGRRVPLEVSARAITREGAAVGIQGIARDLSERRRLETRLADGQKMEAVGRLAGGIAHDFNNLLMVVLGYADLLLSRAALDGPVREPVAQMRQAADSAAALTRQLLAFSRRQVLQPRRLALNEVVGNLERMLRRLIGEDIEVVTRLEATGEIEADPGQIEQVIVNLVVNARDAMPQGGRLVIEAGDADRDGVPHVVLSVADTGTGMTPETERRLFEPFFTTKEQGRGTGLGLSIVYGVVQQHHGAIEVDTALARGTTFRIFLPTTPRGTHPAEPPGEPKVVCGSSATVLLVEDEPSVRELVRDVLTEEGYRVIVAASGSEAMAAFDDEPGGVDLLLTDVVMPGMSGRALARGLAGRDPGLRVIYFSGYTDDVIGHHGVLDADVDYLPKPCRPEDLVRKVREVLAQSPKVSASSS